MLNISATNLKNNLFEILKKVEAGENIIITHNKKEIAHLIPLKKNDWRKKISIKPKLLVSAEEIIKPVEDIWENYNL